MKPIRILPILSLLLFGTQLQLRAQAPPGINELYTLSGEVHQYYYHFSDLALIIGAITGILGGLRVYANWQAGHHHIDAQVMGWFLSCLFLLMSGVFLRGLFGL